MFDRVLLPPDGLPESESIVDEAARLTGPLGHLNLLHVIPDVALPAGEVPRSFFELPEQAESYLEGVLDRVPLVQGRVLVEHGDPAERILRVALELNIDAEGVLRRTDRAVLLKRVVGVPRPLGV